MKGYKKRVLCPVCKLERWVEVSDVLFIRHIVQVALISLLLMSMLFSWLEYRVFIIPVIAWLMFEFLRAAFNREKSVCPQCHFDPFLYKFNRKFAREKCEKRLQYLSTLKKPTTPTQSIKKPAAEPKPPEAQA